MGFQEGSEDEFLLTCIVCASPFGMTSRFCGECGANRDQALGVERARPSQKIRPVEPVYRPEPAYQPDHRTISDAGIGESVQKTAAPTPRKPSRWSNIRVNNAMRIERIVFFLQYHGKKVVTIGLLSFLGFSFVTSQSLIFLSSSPDASINRYEVAVSQRDTNYFTNNSQFTPQIKSIPLLPTRFNSWSEAQAASWINSYSWNGWLKKGTANIQPGANQRSVEVPLVPIEKVQWIIFHNSIWRIKGPMATVHISYPKDSSLPIYINGIYAGTIASPVVAPGTYYAMPGPLVIRYAGNGEKTTNDTDIFIESSGQYEI